MVNRVTSGAVMALSNRKAASPNFKEIHSKGRDPTRAHCTLFFPGYPSVEAQRRHAQTDSGPRFPICTIQGQTWDSYVPLCFNVTK